MITARVAIARLRPGPQSLVRCESLLDPQELARANRFLRSADRDRFIASHAALRLVVGAELGVPPDVLRFDREEGGRPFVAGPASNGFDFNLSHSGDLAVIGCVEGARIGVDVEARRPLPDALRIARSHFASEEASALAALPPEDREGAFFALWTRKEAVVKALGTGLSLYLAAFTVAVPPSPPGLLRIADGGGKWFMAALDVGPGACATVAVTAADCDIRPVSLAEDWADMFMTK